MGLISRFINIVAFAFLISLLFSLIFLVPEVVFILIILGAIILSIVGAIIYDWNNTMKSDGQNIVFQY